MRSERTRSSYQPSISGALVILLSSLLLPPVLVRWSEADGGDRSVIHACVKIQQGTTRIVGANDACGPSETAVHWSITGPQGPPGSIGAPGPAGTASLQLVDSKDRAVGSVVGVEFLNPVVAFNVGGLLFTLKLVEDKLYGYTFPYFSSGDCTGPAHVQRFPGTLPATGVDHRYRVYADSGLDPVAIHVYSYATPDGCVPVNFPLSVVPAVSVLDLGTQFTPPFRLR